MECSGTHLDNKKKLLTHEAILRRRDLARARYQKKVRQAGAFQGSHCSSPAETNIGVSMNFKSGTKNSTSKYFPLPDKDNSGSGYTHYTSSDQLNSLSNCNREAITVAKQIERRRYLSRLRYQKKINGQASPTRMALPLTKVSPHSETFADAGIVPALGTDSNNMSPQRNTKHRKANPEQRKNKRKTSDLILDVPKKLMLAHTSHESPQNVESLHTAQT